MNKIETILELYKTEFLSIKDAKEQILDNFRRISCPNHIEHEVKYLQWQDRWYCTDCQDCIGETKDLV